jgi:FKBP-type peptidyl-prolyl cis-trans isomerase FkpA
MNKFKLYFVVILLALVLFSCNNDSNSSDPVPLRDFAVQYETDSTTIADYLKTHYIQNIVNHPGFADDQDITLAKIPTEGTQSSIWSLLDSPTFPKLLKKPVELHDIVYTVYYLKLREDNTTEGEKPTRVDAVLASYNGFYLKDNSTITDNVKKIDIESTSFESVLYPQQALGLDATIRGWSEIFPQFVSGSYPESSESSPDPAVFIDFGAGVMFLPSGLGYYNGASGSIPSYSPLVFSFKLYKVKRADQDLDGILSVDEDLNGDLDPTNDDTDGDGKPNYQDIDDDGDGALTKNETKRPNIIVNGVSVSNGNYPFNGAVIDNPATLNIDERQGVPNCSADFTNPNRVRKYLDATCR